MDFEDWLLTQSDWSRPALTRLHRLITAAQPHLTGAKKWHAWVFSGRGMVIMLAGFKHHLSLSFHRGAEMEDFAPLFEPSGNDSMRTIRFTDLSQLDLAAIREAVHLAAEIDAAGPAPKKHNPPRPVEVPEPLAAALAQKQHAKARAYFESLSPSCRREYCNWIHSAKREETKASRLEKTLALLNAGKRIYEPKR